MFPWLLTKFITGPTNSNNNNNSGGIQHEQKFFISKSDSINFNDIIENVSESLIRQCEQVTTDTSTTNQIISTIKIENITAEDDIEININAQQAVWAKISSNINSETITKAIRTITQKIAASVLENFKNSTLADLNLEDTSIKRTNLLKSLFDLSPGYNPTDKISTLLENNTRLSNEFSEITQRLNKIFETNENFKAYAQNIQNSIKQLFEAHVNNLNSAQNVIINVSINQLSRTSMISTIISQILVDTLQILDSVNEFSVDKNFLQASKNKTQLEKNTIHEEETISDVIEQGGNAVGTVISSALSPFIFVGIAAVVLGFYLLNKET